jgi:hypothetical protein
MTFSSFIVPYLLKTNLLGLITNGTGWLFLHHVAQNEPSITFIYTIIINDTRAFVNTRYWLDN